MNERNKRLGRDPDLRFGFLDARYRGADVEVESPAKRDQFRELFRLENREIVGRCRRLRWVRALSDIGVRNLDLGRRHVRIEECTPAKEAKPRHSRYSGSEPGCFPFLIYVARPRVAYPLDFSMSSGPALPTPEQKKSLQ